MDHKWHVHVNPEGNDTYAEMGPRCKSLGGHYNPYLVDLAVSIMRASVYEKRVISRQNLCMYLRYVKSLKQPTRHRERHILVIFISLRFFSSFSIRFYGLCMG